MAASTKPLRAMRSISAGDFLTITAGRRPVGPRGSPRGERRDGRAHVRVDFVSGAHPVDPAQQAGVVVVADERLGLGVVDLEPAADRLLLVVVALDQAGAVLVADALVLGRVELDVVDVGRVLDAHAPAGEAPHELVVGHVDQERAGEVPAEAVERRGERVGLVDGAGKPSAGSRRRRPGPSRGP